MEKPQPFDWQRQARAEQFCLDQLGGFRQELPALARFERQLREEASGWLLDWVDHLLLPASTSLRDQLAACGFQRRVSCEQEAYDHPGALLPGLVLTGASVVPDRGVALRVDNLADFLQVHQVTAGIEGSPFGPYRRAQVAAKGGAVLLAVERRGSRDYLPATVPDDYPGQYLAALELWQSRPRAGVDEDWALQETRRRAEALVARLGQDLTAHIVCQAERSYWLARNLAGGLQQYRQNTLGLGWGNHDHYTFRSARRNFPWLVDLFTLLGFHCRERFYAGEEAGWGAQLMENPAAGLTLFLDVDLAPEEVATDFAREELPPREELGTVGLWCALHGDSILAAGLHHLAARFDFPQLISDLARHGIAYMAPFSDFSYLKQAFSVAGRWPVDPARVAGLARDRAISSEQADRFLAQGAIGSHLENIQRREGYKGFNKKNVSVIIRETDPRK